MDDKKNGILLIDNVLIDDTSYDSYDDIVMRYGKSTEKKP